MLVYNGTELSGISQRYTKLIHQVVLRKIRHSSTTWKLFFNPVPYRCALRNWPIIQTLTTNQNIFRLEWALLFTLLQVHGRSATRIWRSPTQSYVCCCCCCCSCCSCSSSCCCSCCSRTSRIWRSRWRRFVFAETGGNGGERESIVYVYVLFCCRFLHLSTREKQRKEGSQSNPLSFLIPFVVEISCLFGLTVDLYVGLIRVPGGGE